VTDLIVPSWHPQLSSAELEEIAAAIREADVGIEVEVATPPLVRLTESEPARSLLELYLVGASAGLTVAVISAVAKGARNWLRFRRRVEQATVNILIYNQDGHVVFTLDPDQGDGQSNPEVQ
jgi:hypothetical protein